MIRVALKGLAGRKLRSLLTAIAIVLGVAMISGTYVLTDTITNAFDTIFTRSYQNTDAVISGKVAFTNDNGNGQTPPSFSDTLLPKVRALPGVAAAVGSIADQAKLIGKNGKVIVHGGAPTLAFSHDPRGDERFNPLKLTSGRWPVGPREIAIDKGTADKEGFALGDTISAQARGPVQRYRVVGIDEFSGVASVGGATFAVFDVPTAQRLFDKVGKLDLIRVAGRSGVPSSRIVSEVRRILPATAQVRDAAAQAKEDEKGVNKALKFIQIALLAFGGVALFVGGFVIANTLAITIAQRTRELATLRTLGASRSQVLRSIVAEALVIGILASVVGLFAGLGLAKVLNFLMARAGIDLPQASAVLATRTVIASLAVGIVITLLASLRPAVRATRVPPIAAVREGAVLPPSRFARFGTTASLAALALSVALLAYGVFGHNLATNARLTALAGGVLLLFFAVALVAKQLVRPLALWLGWPATRIAGAAGSLARENATRNPSRTANTAAALMIGLALVTFVSILGQGLRASFRDAVDKIFVADYAVTSTNGFQPFTIATERRLTKVPGVTAVSGVRGGSGRAFHKTINVTAVEPNASQTLRLDWIAGGDTVPARLGANGAFVDSDYAKSHQLRLGSPIRLQVPSGAFLQLHLVGIFDPPKGGSPFGMVTIGSRAFDANYPAPQDLFAFANIRGGISPANQQRLKSALAAFPDAKVQTRDEFKKSQLQFLDKLLNLLYALLGISIIVSLFGIVNTLVLTIYERTRELGMLRAVGMTRRQVRKMIRHESIITALIGAALGIAIGVFLAALVTHALSDQGIVFAVSWPSLAIFVVAAIVVGIIAAVLPARRASRLNVLEALQYE